MSDAAADMIEHETHWYGGDVTPYQNKALELDNIVKAQQDTAVKLLKAMWAAGQARGLVADDFDTSEIRGLSGRPHPLVTAIFNGQVNTSMAGRPCAPNLGAMPAYTDESAAPASDKARDVIAQATASSPLDSLYDDERDPPFVVYTESAKFAAAQMLDMLWAVGESFGLSADDFLDPLDPSRDSAGPLARAAVAAHVNAYGRASDLVTDDPRQKMLATLSRAPRDLQSQVDWRDGVEDIGERTGDFYALCVRFPGPSAVVFEDYEDSALLLERSAGTKHQWQWNLRGVGRFLDQDQLEGDRNRKAGVIIGSPSPETAGGVLQVALQALRGDIPSWWRQEHAVTVVTHDDDFPWIYNPYWDKPEPPIPFQKVSGYEWVYPDKTDSDGNYIWAKDNSDD
ncbi:hypothetical protein ACIHFD_59205 [Nonomuraea sp. NPDC051941]|uniref:hypothetical protein n=1 Tax=Nonomuraea sp. NPDC051941 TaxID=3364373 RepID=UPI0037CAFFDE